MPLIPPMYHPRPCKVLLQTPLNLNHPLPLAQVPVPFLVPVNNVAKLDMEHYSVLLQSLLILIVRITFYNVDFVIEEIITLLCASKHLLCLRSGTMRNLTL